MIHRTEMKNKSKKKSSPVTMYNFERVDLRRKAVAANRHFLCYPVKKSKKKNNNNKKKKKK